MASSSMRTRSAPPAWVSRLLCQGCPAGRKTTRSSRKASRSSAASRRWPKWTGSNVPPKRPMGESKGSASHVPVAEHDPFPRGEPLEPDGAARVQLVGGDADLRAQTVLEAVGEARGGVHHDGGGVDLAQEALGAGPVRGDDGVGVL